MRQLMDEYERTLSSIIGVQQVPEEETPLSGEKLR
ncbi:hypothetical protein BaLi_c38220 [Bacillus paralicheniformis ATCC 9945a]|nr:hypothetical protein BaLi_c38220 [Bacillus paralicheniformis ATCC 9945a]